MLVHTRLALHGAIGLARALAPFSLALSLMLCALPADARLHKCIDAQGKVTYSDTLCPGTRRSERPAIAMDSPQRISVKQIESLMSAADEANRRKDLDKIMSYYADDAIIEFVVRVGHRTGRQILRKRELFEIAKRHMDELDEYSARREKLSIDIAANGTQAEIRSKVIENWQQNGQRLTMTSEEQNLLELRDGKLLVVHSYVITDGGPKERR